MTSRAAFSSCLALVLFFSFAVPVTAKLKYPIGVGILGYNLECLRDYRFNLTVAYVIENQNSQPLDFIVSFSLLDQTNIRGEREKDVWYPSIDVHVGGETRVVSSFVHIMSSSFRQAKCIIGLWNAEAGALEKSIIINRDSFVLRNGPKGYRRTEFTINWRYEMKALKYNFSYNFVFINQLTNRLSIPIEEGLFNFSEYGGIEKVIFRQDPGHFLNVSTDGFVVKNPPLQIEIPPLSTIRLVLDVEPKRHPIVVARA